jgi:hypothetical protein
MAYLASGTSAVVRALEFKSNKQFTVDISSDYKHNSFLARLGVIVQLLEH